MKGKSELARIALPIDLTPLVKMLNALAELDPGATARAHDGKLVIEVDEQLPLGAPAETDEGAPNA